MDSNKITVTSDDDNKDMADMEVNDKGTMEEVSSENTNAVTPPESVMDVSAPPQDEVIPASPQDASDQDSQSAVVAAPAPEKDAVISPDEQKQEVVLPMGSDPIDAKMKTGASHDSKKHMTTIIVLLLMVVLMAIAALIFLKTKSTTKESTKASTTTTTTTDQAATKEAEAAKVITPAEVDTTAKDIDDTLSTLDEDKDFSTDGLSDKTLGLQ